MRDTVCSHSIACWQRLMLSFGSQVAATNPSAYIPSTLPSPGPQMSILTQDVSSLGFADHTAVYSLSPLQFPSRNKLVHLNYPGAVNPQPGDSYLPPPAVETRTERSNTLLFLSTRYSQYASGHLRDEVKNYGFPPSTAYLAEVAYPAGGNAVPFLFYWSSLAGHYVFWHPGYRYWSNGPAVLQAEPYYANPVVTMLPEDGEPAQVAPPAKKRRLVWNGGVDCCIENALPRIPHSHHVLSPPSPANPATSNGVSEKRPLMAIDNSVVCSSASPSAVMMAVNPTSTSSSINLAEVLEDDDWDDPKAWNQWFNLDTPSA